MIDKTTTIAELQQKAASFINERNWRQFHGAKNLSMAITLEAAELMEIFTWARDQKEAAQLVEEKKEAVKHELADIVFATLVFCDEFNIDLSEAIIEKIAHNAKKYPIEKAKGMNKKYNEL
jgi:NTP pyrophosphatase (non-canonical NTP hydrolase)